MQIRAYEQYIREHSGGQVVVKRFPPNVELEPKWFESGNATAQRILIEVQYCTVQDTALQNSPVQCIAMEWLCTAKSNGKVFRTVQDSVLVYCWIQGNDATRPYRGR